MKDNMDVKYEFACLYINLLKDPDLRHTYDICQYLLQAGLQIVLDADSSDKISQVKKLLTNKFQQAIGIRPQFLAYTKERPTEINECGFFIAIGGDGTFLEAVHHALCWDWPLVGLKLGRLGFLAAVTEQNYQQKLSEIISGKCLISKRLLLDCQIVTAKGEIRNYLIFNDLVLNRLNISRIAEFSIRIDGTLADLVPADGIIVATPSGSTAYALAAGGAIIDPSADVLEISPICPHSLHNRSYVVNSSSAINISFPPEQQEEVCVFIDGKAVSNMPVTASLTVSKADVQSKILTFRADSFVANLEQKLKSH